MLRRHCCCAFAQIIGIVISGIGLSGIATAADNSASSSTPCMSVLDKFTAPDVPDTGPAEIAVDPRKPSTRPTPTGLPGSGLAQHPMLYIGEGYNRMFLVNGGKVIWKYDTGPGNEYDDVWMLSNALRPDREIFVAPPHLFPGSVQWSNVVAVNLRFLQNPQASGIFNLGSGRAQPFNDIAWGTINTSRALKGQTPLTLEQMVQQGLVEYIPFPDALVGKYQCHTQADLARLRAAGCDHAFADVATGVERYVRWLARS